MGKLGLSATEIGRSIGASAEEVNRLLKDQGFLYGSPGAYGLTSKGEALGVQRNHDNGHTSIYNVNYDTTHFDPKILDALDSSHEQVTRIRAELAADRQARRDARKAEEAEAEARRLEEEAEDEAARLHAAAQAERDAKTLLYILGSIVVAAGVAFGVHKGIEWNKRRKARKAEREASDQDASVDVEEAGE